MTGCAPQWPAAFRACIDKTMARMATYGLEGYRLPHGKSARWYSFEGMHALTRTTSQRQTLEQEQRSETVTMEMVSGSWCGASTGRSLFA